MARNFNLHITTKLHRLMRHVCNHFLFLGCLRRGSSEANEKLNKRVKENFNNTNKHIAHIAPQLLRAESDSLQAPSTLVMNGDNNYEEADIQKNFGTESVQLV